MSEQDGGQRETERRDEAEEMARLQEQINNLPVSEHLLYMLHSLSSLAVDRLGLTPEGGARRDLPQAQLAIEAFRSLLGVLETARPEEIAAHRGVLSQLQLAYVGALNAAPAGTAAPEAAAEEPADEVPPEAPKAAADEVPPETVAKKAAKPRASSKGTTKSAPKATGRATGGAAGKGGKKGS